MTSSERREARYKRRKAARLARKKARCAALGTIDQVFSFRKMFFWGRKCCNGVGWKQSTQNFALHLFSGTAVRRRKVLKGKWRPGKCVHFPLMERGKRREIDAPHISDRQVEKVLSKEILVPLYTPGMIHDNYASRKGMGLHYGFQRIKEALRWHYTHYGRKGGIALIDLKSSFPDANRALIYQRHKELIFDDALRRVADVEIDTAPKTAPGRGMPLGKEPSQQEMTALPSAVDNWLKCQVGVHCAGHYMDDYYIIGPDEAELRKIANAVVRKFEALGIRVNRRKCKFVPLTKPFKFCKATFRLKNNGKIVVNGNRDGMKRARRKLRLFHQEWLEDKRTLEDIAQWMTGQCSYYRNYNDHGRQLRLWRICYAIFNGRIVCTKSRAQVTAPTSA